MFTITCMSRRNSLISKAISEKYENKNLNVMIVRFNSHNWVSYSQAPTVSDTSLVYIGFNDTIHTERQASWRCKIGFRIYLSMCQATSVDPRH